MVTYRSVSQLKLASRCGEQYRLERVEKVRSLPAAWTALGIALHETFECWELAERVFGLEHLEACFTDHYDQQIEKYKRTWPEIGEWQRRPNCLSTLKDIDYHRERGLTVDVPNYYRYCQDSDWKPYRDSSGELYVEKEFRYVFQGPTPDEDIEVPGAVDMVAEYPDGRLVIRDLKSGREEPNDTRQLGWYGFVARELWGLPVTYGQYFYTKGGKTREGKAGDWVELSRFGENFWEDQFRSLDNLIDRQLYLFNPGSQCDMCGVRRKCRLMGWE